MAEAIHDMMGAVLARWMMGAAAAPAASAWRAELGTDPTEAELRLLALSGQFLGVAVTVEPPETVRTLPDIPPLALPPLPDALRPPLRRVFAAAKDGRTRSEVLHLLATRGRTAHPADWLPAASDDDVPEIYAPWRDWAAVSAATGPIGHRATDALTAESWDDFWPAMRKAAFAELRQRDPAAARALMDAKFAGADADERLRLLGLLAAKLSLADREFLEKLIATDRAPKVKALAAQLLGRLGYGAAVGEDAAELAGFFQLRTTGLFRRTRTVAPLPLKSDAQGKRRHQLFAEIELSSFAAALAVAPDEIAELWTWREDVQADLDFVAMAARSGSDGLVTALAAALQRQNLCEARMLVPLRPRLDIRRRTDLAARAIAAGSSFADALSIAGGVGRIDKAIDTPAGIALIEALGTEGRNPAPQAAELAALGLIASVTAAARAIERLVGIGMLGADPRLDVLRLNAALDETKTDFRGTTE